MDTNDIFDMVGVSVLRRVNYAKSLFLWWRRRMGIEPTHRGLNPEHWI